MSKQTVLSLLAACVLVSVACNKSTTETKPAEETAAAPAADAPAADAAAPAADAAPAAAAAAAATGLIEGKVLFAVYPVRDYSDNVWMVKILHLSKYLLVCSTSMAICFFSSAGFAKATSSLNRL